jgi:tetratricopeptide (TPR) repeat protein
MAGAQREALERADGHYRRGELQAAEETCRTVLKRDRRCADAIQMLGLIAFQRHDLKEAAACYRRCLAIRPREPRFHYLLGKVATVQGRFDEAIARFDAALRLSPAYRPAIAWKAVVLERRGDTEAALRLVEPFVAQGSEDEDMAEVYANVTLRGGRPADATPVLERQLARGDLRQISRAALTFLLGRAREQAREYDAAFEAYSRANELTGAVFDERAWVRETDRLIAAFSRERLATLPRGANASELPVFIAGMPRSGTTLIEQIIDAHPEAAGLGEITDLEEIAATLATRLGSSRAWPECAADITQRAADQAGRVYLDRIGRLARRAKRIVNKSLENYRNLGLVALLLPRARILHCRRDSLDACMSCYASHLMPPRHAYASDLRHLGLAYREYERLMSHWQEVLDLPILEVRYEELVADPLRVGRQIVEFCGLAWDERCLTFHESGRFAYTLSYDQVRRPIYDSSIGRAGHFQRHLGPLREALCAGESPPLPQRHGGHGEPQSPSATR